MTEEQLPSLTGSDALAMERELHAQSFTDFIRDSWHTLHSPEQPYVHNWHVDAIADHLMAVHRGEITRLLINIPYGMSKPVSSREPVVTARGIVPLSDVQIGDQVLTHRGRYRRVTAVHEQGELDVVRVNTDLGRSIVAAPDHPFLTPDGWRSAGDLREGETLGSPRLLGGGTGEVSPEEARLLGYLVGDGGITRPEKQVRFCSQDEQALEDFESCAEAFGFYTRRTSYTKPSGGMITNVILRSSPGRGGVRRDGPSPVVTWLERHGLAGTDSYTKRLPTAVFASGVEAIENFVGAYWTCDGCTQDKVLRQGRRFTSSATTVSKGLAHDLQQALALIGINCRFEWRSRERKTKKQGDWHTSYAVSASSKTEVSLFRNLSGLCDDKRSRIQNVFPTSFGERILLPDSVSSIETGTAPEPCRCLTVEEDQSFVAGGVAVHNSLLSTVLFPAWEWSAGQRPHLSYMCASYEMERLGKRDLGRMRSLVGSEWYQQRYGDLVQIDPKNDTKEKFHNRAGGFRETRPIGGMTGGRADRVIIDDPHSTEGAESEAERERTLRIFSESIPSRLNKPRESAIIVIMQRLHERDVSGHILEQELGYDHLILPMRFEKDHPIPNNTRLGFTDPRSEEGELLFPERFPESVVASDEQAFGGPHSFAASGQLQQRPEPRGGGLIRVDRIERHATAPMPGTIRSLVRYWDKASSKSTESAYTAGVLMARMIDGFTPSYVVLDVARGRWSAGERDRMIREVAELDQERWGRVQIYIEQEPGPVSVDEPVLLPNGLMKRAGDLEPGDRVVNGEGFPTNVVEVHDQGEIEALRIETATGRILHVGREHPMLTPYGWKPAEELDEEDVLALRGTRNVTPTSEPTLEECRLAGYFVGDGCCTSNNALITCHDTLQAEDVVRCFRSIGDEPRIDTSEYRGKNRGVYSGRKVTKAWLRERRLAGKGTLEKTVPDWVMSASDKHVAHFVGAFYACDGCVSGEKNNFGIELYNTNLPLLEQVQSLLLRLGVNAYLRRRVYSHEFQKTRHVQYRLIVRKKDDSIQRFGEVVPIPGVKGQRLEQAGLRRSDFTREVHPDEIKSIEPAGKVHCTCPTVAEGESFLIRDVVVHNSGGKDSYQATAQQLAGYEVWPDRVTGDKTSRAGGLASQVEAGNVAVLDNRPWTLHLMNELEKFPNGRYKDQGDAMAGAFTKLTATGFAGAWGSRKGKRS